MGINFHPSLPEQARILLYCMHKINKIQKFKKEVEIAIKSKETIG